MRLIRGFLLSVYLRDNGSDIEDMQEGNNEENKNTFRYSYSFHKWLKIDPDPESIVLAGEMQLASSYKIIVTVFTVSQESVRSR